MTIWSLRRWLRGEPHNQQPRADLKAIVKLLAEIQHHQLALHTQLNSLRKNQYLIATRLRRLERRTK